MCGGGGGGFIGFIGAFNAYNCFIGAFNDSFWLSFCCCFDSFFVYTCAIFMICQPMILVVSTTLPAYSILYYIIHYTIYSACIESVLWSLTMNLWSLGEGGGVSKKQDVCIHVMLLLALWLIWLYNSFRFNNVHPGQFLPVAVDSCMYFRLFTAINIWLEQPSTYWHSNIYIYIYIYLYLYIHLSLSLYIYISIISDRRPNRSLMYFFFFTWLNCC